MGFLSVYRIRGGGGGVGEENDDEGVHMRPGGRWKRVHLVVGAFFLFFSPLLFSYLHVDKRLERTDMGFC